MSPVNCIKRYLISSVRTLAFSGFLIFLGLARTDAYADPTADRLRFSAVTAWQATVTIRGDGEGSPNPLTTYSDHETITASFTLELEDLPRASLGDKVFSARPPSNKDITCTINFKTTIKIPTREPPCELVYAFSSNPNPIPEWYGGLVLHSAGTYSLIFNFSQPYHTSIHDGCSNQKLLDSDRNLGRGLFTLKGKKLFSDQPLPSSGTTLTGSAELSEPNGSMMNFPMTWTATWKIEPKQVEVAQKETIPECCEGPGSIIGFENQSLGEVVNITGTPFQLHYQSDRAVGRNLVNPAAASHARALGGWTLSSHHRYDPKANELYLGDGGQRDSADLGAVKSSVAGGFLIASRDTSTVYEFATNGAHLRTLHGFTGATIQTFSYDSKGFLIDIVDGDGNRTGIQREPNGSVRGISGPYGQTTRLTVDANGYLASITHPSGAVEKFTTTPKGLLTAYTNARNKTSKFSYDDLGRLNSDTDASGETQSLTRNETASAFTVTLKTAEGRTNQYQTTPANLGGEARTITGTAGLKSQTSRDASGAITTALPDGTQTTQALEADSRFGQSAAIVKSSRITTPSGLNFATAAARKVTLAHAANPFSLSTLVETLTVNGRTYARAYDGANRSFEYKTPAGRILRTDLDLQGRVSSESTGGLYPVAKSYDARGRLSSVSQGDGADMRKLELKYDSLGYLESLTDPLGRSVSFVRNTMGRVEKQTLADGQTIGYAYDANDNITAVTPPGRLAHEFTYSDVDQALSYSAPKLGSLAANTVYTYNRDRQLVGVTQPGGQMIARGYDSAGRSASLTIKRGSYGFAYDVTTGHLNNIAAPGGIGLAYAYDGNLVTSSTLTGVVAGGVQYAYDGDFRVKELRVNNTNPVNFQFDQDGLLTNAGAFSLVRDSMNGLLATTMLGRITDSFSYDRFGAVTVYAAKFNDREVLRSAYSYDKLGRITTRTETIAGITNTFEYIYDLAGRLAQVKTNAVIQSTFAYDSNGNCLTRAAAGATVSGTYDHQDRSISYGGTTYAYTANGDLKQKTDGTQNTDYAYDELGNLLSVALPGGKKIDYLVDGRNRRIGKIVNGELVRAFLYQDGLKPIAELDRANNVVTRFVYATHANVPDYMIKAGVTYRIINDHLGSPRLVIAVDAGTLVQRMDYDESGNVLADSNPGFQPFGFAGGLYDSDTKLVRFGARDYDSESGRWTTRDPIGFAGGDSNLYAYVLNDPVNHIDPQGRSWKAKGRAIMAALEILLSNGRSNKVGKEMVKRAEMEEKVRQLNKAAKKDPVGGSKCVIPIAPSFMDAIGDAGEALMDINQDGVIDDADMIEWLNPTLIPMPVLENISREMQLDYDSGGPA